MTVIGYEWSAELVDDGNRLAARYGDPVTLQCQDVMAENLPWPPQAHGVALHACGDLHRKLIRDGVERRQPRLSFSPAVTTSPAPAITTRCLPGPVQHRWSWY